MKNYPIKLAGQLWLGKKYFCALCGKEVEGFNDQLSAKEFRISHLCQDCQDATFKTEVEENQAEEEKIRKQEEYEAEKFDYHPRPEEVK